MILSEKIAEERKKMDGHRKNWQKSCLYHGRLFLNGRVHRLYRICRNYSAWQKIFEVSTDYLLKDEMGKRRG